MGPIATKPDISEGRRWNKKAHSNPLTAFADPLSSRAGEGDLPRPFFLMLALGWLWLSPRQDAHRCLYCRIGNSQAYIPTAGVIKLTFQGEDPGAR